MQHHAQCMLITAYDDSCILNNCCPPLSVIWSKIKNYINKTFHDTYTKKAPNRHR